MAGKTNIDRAVREIVGAFRNRGAEVERIVLFGSRARRRASKDSDLDLAIVSPFFNGKNVFQRQVFLGGIKWEIGEIIDPMGYTAREFAKPQPGTFLAEIKRTGKVLYRRK